VRLRWPLTWNSPRSQLSVRVVVYQKSGRSRCRCGGTHPPGDLDRWNVSHGHRVPVAHCARRTTDHPCQPGQLCWRTAHGVVPGLTVYLEGLTKDVVKNIFMRIGKPSIERRGRPAPALACVAARWRSHSPRFAAGRERPRTALIRGATATGTAADYRKWNSRARARWARPAVTRVPVGPCRAGRRRACRRAGRGPAGRDGCSSRW
jgi:hypothetical protein